MARRGKKGLSSLSQRNEFSRVPSFTQQLLSLRGLCALCGEILFLLSSPKLHMRQAWQFPAHTFLKVAVDLGVDHHLTVGGTRQGFAPRVDDHRVAEIHDAARATADLVGGDEIYLVLDGA